MLLSLKQFQSEKKIRIARVAFIAALAIGQCTALTACGRRAMLSKTPVTNGGGNSGGTTSPANTDSPDKKQNTPAAGNNAGAGAQGNTTAPSAASGTLAQGIQDLRVEITGDNQLKVTFDASNGSSSSVGTITLTGNLAEILTSVSGGDLRADGSQEKLYSGHFAEIEKDGGYKLTINDLTAKTSATATIRQPILGKVSIHNAGTPTDTQADIASLIASYDSKASGALIYASVASIDGGKSFVFVDVRMPGDAKTLHEVSLSSELPADSKATTTVTLKYYDKAGDESTATPVPADASTVSVGADGSIHFSLGGEGDHIQSIDLTN